MVMSALESATLQIEAQAMQFSRTQLPPIREETPAVAESFMIALNGQFDALFSPKVVDPEVDVTEYGNLSLVDDDYLEAIIAMEGMVNHARNCDIQQYISFTTRLDSLFPNLHIDETNNPLDPEQIGACFSDAIKPLGLKAHYLLTIYREFNKAVFHHLEEVLEEANEVLIEYDVLPNMDIKARNKELQRKKRAVNRPTTDRETRAFEEAEASGKAAEESKQANVEMFAMMQKLVKSLAEKDQNDSSSSSAQSSTGKTEGSGEPQLSNQELLAEQKALKEQQSLLLDMLGDIQSSIRSAEQDTSNNSKAITESINNSLKAGSESGEIGPLNSLSSDVIKLVTLLYEAIWSDDSLPVVMKELIGRTQISIMKIALLDTGFFDDEKHPGRVLLNEFAMAGIAWTEISMLESDPVYSKVKELVERLIANSDADNGFLQGLIDDLRVFKSKHGETDASLEQRLRESDDHGDRLDDVNEFVTQKINERIIRDDIDPSIRNLLDTHFHDFLVKLVLKEGPGGSSWKPVMSTIDVLLWTIKSDKDPGDKKRFEKINPRLLDNIEKALEIGGASKSKSKKIIRQLKQVQEYSFHMAEISSSSPINKAPSQASTPQGIDEQPRKKKELPPLPKNDPYLRQVDKFPIGIWLEFKGAAGQPVRCTLAAKIDSIDSIDKMFFVNRQGVKVVELDRMRLARELKAGSVKIVSEGSLVDRALESVISNLRESAPSKVTA